MFSSRPQSKLHNASLVYFRVICAIAHSMSYSSGVNLPKQNILRHHNSAIPTTANSSKTRKQSRTSGSYHAKRCFCRLHNPGSTNLQTSSLLTTPPPCGARWGFTTLRNGDFLRTFDCMRATSAPQSNHLFVGQVSHVNASIHGYVFSLLFLIIPCRVLHVLNMMASTFHINVLHADRYQL